MRKKLHIRSLLSITIGMLVLIFVCDNASFAGKRSKLILAEVNGDQITEDELAYALTIEHRRERLSKTGALDLRGYLEKLIDDKLIVQEAIQMGLDEDPAVKRKIRAFIVRESVTQLYNDRILSKIKVSDEEALEYFKKNYKEYHLQLIELDDKEKAERILKEAQSGKDFGELAKKYSIHPSASQGGKVVYTVLNLKKSPRFESYVKKMKKAEIIGPLEFSRRYYLVKLIDIKEPDLEKFQKVKDDIKRRIKRIKENRLSQKYLKELKKKVKIWKNKELIDTLIKAEKENKLDELLKTDKSRVVARVNDYVLTLEEIIIYRKENPRRSIATLIQKWIDTKVVDIEALKQGYENKEPLKSKIKRYKEYLLKKTFIGTAVVPQVKIDQASVKEYYEKNKDRFRSPTLYRIQQITVGTEEEAKSLIKELKAGADFGWLAKRRSQDSFSQFDGMIGWKTKEQMPKRLQELIDKMKIGDFTNPIKTGTVYRIVRLEDKKPGEIKPFDSVKKEIRRRLFNKEVERLLKKYIETLRKDSEIVVYEDAIKEIENKFKKSSKKSDKG